MDYTSFNFMAATPRSDNDDYDEFNQELDEKEWTSQNVGEETRRIADEQIELMTGEGKDWEVTPIVEPVLIILNRACFELTPEEANRVLVFIKNHDYRKKLDDFLKEHTVFEETMESERAGANNNRPELVGLFVPRETARKMVAGEIGPEDPDWPSVPTTQRLASFVDCQTDTYAFPREGKQLRRSRSHLRILMRHRTAYYSSHHAFVVTKKSFRLVAYGIRGHFTWPRVRWSDEKCIEKLYVLVGRMLDEEIKACEKSLKIPRLESVLQVKKDRKVTIHTVTLKDQRYRLLELVNRKVTFVGIGSTGNSPNDARILKYSWYSDDHPSREREFLERLIGTPGVVEIDSELSQEAVEVDEGRKLKRNLLALKTIGFPLGSCGSVREFLEAMYDLLEGARALLLKSGFFKLIERMSNSSPIPGQGKEGSASGRELGEHTSDS